MTIIIDRVPVEAVDLAPVATSGDYDDLTDKPVLADVATSSQYSDLVGTPPAPNKRVYRFTYDFDVLGGATGTIALTASDGALPNNFVIQQAWIDVLTPLDSALHLATVALTTGQGAGDLVVAALVSAVPWSAGGPKVTIALLQTIGTWIKTTAGRSPAVVVAIENLTAGRFNLMVEGVVSA